MKRLLRVLLPVGLFLGLIAFWEWSVAHWQVPQYILPAPSGIWGAFETDGNSLMRSAWTTLGTTLAAFVLAVVSGTALATLFAASRIAEASLSPYAVILQVTPVVAIAPLIIVWVGLDQAWLAVLILAWIVAFFPVLASATAGLKAVDPNLRDLFRLYRAGFWETFRRLMVPSALPYLLAGVKTAGGLALGGAVIAEFAAASGTTDGLAWRILEAGNRLQIAKMFAALVLLALIGLAIYGVLSLVEWMLLHRWHGERRRR
jgi:NitT/TauT family transport system permease protein